MEAIALFGFRFGRGNATRCAGARQMLGGIALDSSCVHYVYSLALLSYVP